MIDGVTVLSQTEIMETPYTIIIVIISAIISTIIFAVLDHLFLDNIGPENLIIAILFSIVVGCVYFNIAKEPTGRYEYEVLIDESVHFVELTEQYDIIEKMD